MGWIVKVGVGGYLRECEMEKKGREFYGYFKSKGFRIERVGGMLGKLEEEWKIKGGMKEWGSGKSGWGLIEWRGSNKVRD